jgi:hypothetical protein
VSPDLKVNFNFHVCNVSFPLHNRWKSFDGITVKINCFEKLSFWWSKKYIQTLKQSTTSRIVEEKSKSIKNAFNSEQRE